MSKLRCIVADDEPLAVRLLSSYVARTDFLELAGAYTSARAALVALQTGTVDLALLDIQMPQLTGLELARAIANTSTLVIFVTAYKDYAIEGFKVHAFDYLLKPVSYDEFLAAVSRAKPAEEPPQTITVKSDYRRININIDDISYIEGLKDYVKIHTATRERPVLTHLSMKGIEAMLPASEFVRIHRSFIVATKRITHYDRSCVTIHSYTLPIGDTYRAKVSALLAK